VTCGERDRNSKLPGSTVTNAAAAADHQSEEASAWRSVQYCRPKWRPGDGGEGGESKRLLFDSFRFGRREQLDHRGAVHRGPGRCELLVAMPRAQRWALPQWAVGERRSWIRPSPREVIRNLRAAILRSGLTGWVPFGKRLACCSSLASRSRVGESRSREPPSRLHDSRVLHGMRLKSSVVGCSLQWSGDACARSTNYFANLSPKRAQCIRELFPESSAQGFATG